MRALIVGLVILGASCIACAQDDQSVDHGPVMQRFLTDDVIGIGYLDLEQLSLEPMAKAVGVGVVSGRDALEFAEQFKTLDDKIDSFRKIGFRSIYVFFRASDISNGGVSWVAPVAKEQGSKALELLLAVTENMPENARLAMNHVERNDGYILVAASSSQLEQMKKERPQQSRFSPFMNELFSGAAGLAIIGDRDSRRVVAEILPQLNPPWNKVSRNMISEHILAAGIKLETRPSCDLSVHVQTNNESVAQSLVGIGQDGLALIAKSHAIEEALTKPVVRTLMDAAEIRRDGMRVSLTFGELFRDLDSLVRNLSGPIKLARQEARRVQQMQNMKQIGLALHNYASAHNKLPTYAFRDESGNPLLSWRVHILPLMRQWDVYNKFHLDEPWDSEHNLKLVREMPDVFKDLRPGGDANNKLGNTTMQLPIGDALIFGRMGTKAFREIIDGTSNTIMMGCVSQKNAVPWSQPSDWEVDFDAVFAKLSRNADGLPFLFADGSVRVLPAEANAQTLKALLTAGGGEIVEMPR